MIIVNFYFSLDEKWIEHEIEGVVVREEFHSDEELRNFININNLPLTYKGCFNC
jgi:hypothetical protein